MILAQSFWQPLNVHSALPAALDPKKKKKKNQRQTINYNPKAKLSSEIVKSYISSKQHQPIVIKKIICGKNKVNFIRQSGEVATEDRKSKLG